MSEIAQAVESGVKDVAEHAGGRFGQIAKDFYEQTGKRMITAAENTAKTDLEGKQAFEAVLKDGEQAAGKDAEQVAVKDAEQAAVKDGEQAAVKDGETAVPHGKDAPSGTEPQTKPLGEGDPVPESSPLQCRPGSKDPVDLVTGAVLLPQWDVLLPATLPLTLERAHISTYQKGRFFGPRWASTLDQRLEQDDNGLHYAAPDGVVLHYPVPLHPGAEVFPSEGARWPLHWEPETDTYLIRKPAERLSLRFPAHEPDGSVRPLGTVTDANGNTIRHHYDAAGIPTLIEHSGGYRIGVRATPTPAGPRIEELRLLDGTDSGTLIRHFDYDQRGRLTGVADSSGVPQVLEYDGEHRITAWIDRNGFRYDYEYGADGRVVRSGGSAGFYTAAFAYDDDARTTVLTDSLGNATTFYWDERGQVMAVGDASGGRTLVERDRYDRVTARIDQLGRATRYELLPDGRPTAVTQPGGQTVRIDYDATGLPVRMTRPDGAEYRYTYDERGNRLAVLGPAGFAVRNGYDARGGMVSSTDSLGRTTTFDCDATGQPVASTDPTGAVVRMRYNAFGLPIEIVDPAGRVTTLGWSPEGRPLWRATDAGTREEWRYDGEGNLLAWTSITGQVTTFEYGPFDTLLARTDPGGARYEYGYDTERRPTSVTLPDGLVWRYEYDAAGNLVGETDHTGRALAYRRDATGALLAKINGAGEAIGYTRDSNGLLTSQAIGEAVTRFTRDADGRLLRAQSPGGVLEYTYDPAGRVATETVDGRTTRYAYDADGRRVRRITPSGALSEWDYDVRGLPSALRTASGRLDFEHDASGRETIRRFGPKVALTSAYDSLGQLANQALFAYSQPGSTRQLVQQYWYSFGADQRLAAVGDLITGERSLALDPMGRPTAVAGGESYAYDALGNLVRAESPGDPDTQGEFVRGGGLLRRAGRTHYDYDGQNRLTRMVRRTLSGNRRVWLFRWDAADRLTEATMPDGAMWRYSYDPLGRRTAKRHIGANGAVERETLFCWDGARLSEQYERGPSGTGIFTTWDWEPGTSRAAAQRVRGGAAEAFYAIVTDLAGSPVDLVNADGRAVWHRSANLFGATVGGDGASVDCALRFPGQYADPETGLHYNVHRYYDPATAQYLSPDPLRLNAGPNDRAYPANPLIQSDPLGLASYGMVPLNDPNNEMAQIAAAERMSRKIDPSQNVAVYKIGTEPNHSYLAAANTPGGLHSEERLDAYLQANGIGRDQVTGVYSERIPCIQSPTARVQHNCAQLVAGYPNAQNNLSFSLNSDEMGMGVRKDNWSRIASSMGGYQAPSVAPPTPTWI